MHDDSVANQLIGMRDQILVPVTAIIQEILQDPTLTLAYSGTVQWEEGGTPATGGDGYRFRLVIIDDS